MMRAWVMTSVAVMPSGTCASAGMALMRSRNPTRTVKRRTLRGTISDGPRKQCCKINSSVGAGRRQLAFLPAILLMMTSFTRIIIVLALLRQALGTQSSPPNQVLVGLALFLTLFVMGPVFDRVYNDAYRPLSERTISFDQAMDRAEPPLKSFMLRQTREPDLALFTKLARIEELEEPASLPLRVVVPAFVTSELKTAFQIGFMIFIPFLIIDIVVASVLMSMGMMMLSPMLIALPFKLMLFVLVDVWQLLIGSLAASIGN